MPAESAALTAASNSAAKRSPNVEQNGPASPSAVGATAATRSTDAAPLWRALLGQPGRAFLAHPDGAILFATREFAAAGSEGRAWLVPAVQRVRDTGYERRERVIDCGAPAEAALTPIFDEAGAMVAISGVLLAPGEPGRPEPLQGEDLARIAMEATIDESEKRIAELETALAGARDETRRNATFLAEMSHELRTPLNAIIGFSEAALQQVRGPLPPAYREYLEDIHRAGRHLADIAEGVLDAARIESGHLALELRPVSARVLLAEASSMVALKAAEDGVDISAVALKGDFLVEADPIRARQILVNLLGNAVKFTPRGAAVGVDAMALDDDFIDLTVWDNGVGIDEAEQRRVFEAFYQVSGQPFRVGGKGAGLGLAIARQLARHMGGDVLLWSEPGKGSRFTVRLRRVREAG